MTFRGLQCSTAMQLCLALASSTYCFAANAQEATEGKFREILDDNGVDLTSGSVSVSDDAISIGSGDSGLYHQRPQVGKGGDKYHMAITLKYSFNVSGGMIGAVIVTIGGSGEEFLFSGNPGSRVYSSYYRTGSKLVENSSAFVYTDRNGIVTTFDKSLMVGSSIGGRGTSVIMPDGTNIAIHYKTNVSTAGHQYARIQSVVNNRGYQLKYEYNTNTFNGADPFPWVKSTKVTAFNRAIDYCDPNADLCSFSMNWPSISYSDAVEPITNHRILISNVSGVRENRYVVEQNGGPVRSVRRGPAGSPATDFHYDSNDRVSSVVGPKGTWSYVWLAENLADGDPSNDKLTLTRTDPLYRQIVSVVNPTYMQSKVVTDELGRTIHYGYSVGNNLDYIVFPEGAISSTTPVSGYVQYSYDNRGNRTQTTRVAKAGSGLPNITTFSGYDGTCSNPVTCNKPNWTKDEKGNQTDYTYDSGHGGVLAVTRPAPYSGAPRPQTRFSYTPKQAFYKGSSGSIVASGQGIYVLTGTSICKTSASCTGNSDEIRGTTDFGPQVNGTANNLMPVATTKASGDNLMSSTSSVTYDAIGNVLTVDGPLAGLADSQRTVYDALRRPVGQIGPDPDGSGPLPNQATRTTYDALGRVVLVESGTTPGQTDAAWANFSAQAFATSTYNTANEKIRQAVGSGADTYSLTQYSYDAGGRLECAAQRMNRAAYAALPASACTLGTSGSDGPDRIAKFTYDNVDQITQTQRGYGTGAVVTEAAGYTPNGKVAWGTDGKANRTTYEYDGYDRLSKTRYPVTTPGANSSSTTDYDLSTYDAASNVTSVRLRDGSTTTLAYDNLNRLTSRTPQGEPTVSFAYNLLDMTTAVQRGSDGANIAYSYDGLGRLSNEAQPYGSVGYQYDAAGRAVRLTWGDGFYVNYVRDPLGRITQIRENGATTGLGLLATYSYDNLGRRASVSYGNGTSRSYAYDAIGRLAGLKIDLADTVSDQLIGQVGGVGTAIGYNPASQIKTISRSNDAYAYGERYNVNRPYAVNGLNQYTSAGAVNFSYDSRGNLNMSGSSAFGYNKLNQLISGPGVTQKYDGLGRLIQYDAPSILRSYYSGGSLVAEVSSSSSVLRRFVPGPSTDEPIVWYEGSGTAGRRWLQADERGSVVAVSDDLGNAININTYDEYGIPAATNLGRFQYTGQAWYPELGLYYYKARYYSPSLGRFMQTDPIGYGDGLNIYAYVGNDPINRSDPSGLQGDNASVLEYTQNLANGIIYGDIVVVAGFVNPNFSLSTKIDLTGGLSFDLGSYIGMGRYDFGLTSNNATPSKPKRGQGREVPCSSLRAFNDAVRDSSFADTLANAAAGDVSRRTEHSFVYGPLFYMGPDIFDSHPPSRSGNFSNTSETFLVPSPRISFHTHRDASEILSNEDFTSAVDNGYPTAIYDLKNENFRCVVRK